MREMDVETLRTWLEQDRPALVLDVRPIAEREEWAIPGSVHMDAYAELQPMLTKQIVIYVISSSVSHSDIERARAIKAVKDYYIKPITLEQYAHMLKGI